MPTKKESNKTSLFSAKKIEGYTVKPWSLAMMEELSPCLERLIVVFKEKGIALDKVQDEIPKVIFTILPEVKTILSVTLKEDVEIVKEFDLGKVLALSLVIVSQNMEVLKNSFGPVSSLINQMAKMALSGL